MRLGIFGGAFNPPHLGHLAVACAALSQLGLERVVLMPSHTPPHKRALEDPGPQHRLRMCQLAVEDRAGLCACALEVERGGPSYTVDTLLALHARHLGIEPTLILGSDMARTLPTWRSPSRLLELAHVAVAERSGDGRREVLAALGSLRPSLPPRSSSLPPSSSSLPLSSSSLPPGSPSRPPGSCADHALDIVFLEMPTVEVSSSLVRARVAGGEPVADLVGPAVATYIGEHRLYRHPAGNTAP